MSFLAPNPFEEPAFLEGLEAAGYLQRLDVSEERITARFQHALTKMQFAAHSEEFLTRAGVRKVIGSTVHFFNEHPTVSDPFVHISVGSLPAARQALVTPHGLPTTGWTPIGSPDEADGTMHFTVSHTGFWPFTVVLDSNQANRSRESKYAPISDSEESDAEAYLRASRSARGSSSRRSRRASLAALEDSASDSSESDSGAGIRGLGGISRSASAASYRSTNRDRDDGGYRSSASQAAGRGTSLSRSQSRASTRSRSRGGY